MKAFLLSILVMVLISIGANQILLRMEAGGAIGGTSSTNARVN